jgi:hypothetical protein
LPVPALAQARATLAAHGDFLNAAHAAHLQSRRSLLLGQLGEAERILATIDSRSLPPARRAAHEMIVAGLAMRRLRTADARRAFARAGEAARLAGIAALKIEVENASRILRVPVARMISRDRERPALLHDVETLMASGAMIVNACRRAVRCANLVIPLANRPVLFTLARVLAEAWNVDVRREILIEQAFAARAIDESDRVRLRVEIGRLRKLLEPMATIVATAAGYALKPARAPEVIVLAWPADEEHGAVLSFLADGEAWSTSALAVALGVSQRTVQRALDALSTEGNIHRFGRGRARRWTASTVPGFTSILLLPDPLAD